VAGCVATRLVVLEGPAPHRCESSGDVLDRRVALKLARRSRSPPELAVAAT
jgi:hypothetical protein